jgi:hypothetical protein
VPVSQQMAIKGEWQVSGIESVDDSMAVVPSAWRWFVHLRLGVLDTRDYDKPICFHLLTSGPPFSLTIS